MNMTIKVAETDTEIDSCFPVMSLLRPHLQRDKFVGLVRKMFTQGYGLAFLEADGHVRAVVGYRIMDMLRTGRMLEVDDLISETSERLAAIATALRIG